MSGQSGGNGDRWDQLAELFASEVRSMSAEEVRAAVEQEGLDTTRGKQRVLKALRERDLRQRLAGAAGRRGRLRATLESLMAKPVEDLRQGLDAIVQTCVPPAQRAVFFNKLSEATTEEDLRSLAVDIAALNDLFDGDTEPERGS